MLRRYRSPDAEGLAGLFRESVLTLGASFYSGEELGAWASFGDRLEDFRRSLGEGFTLVAESDGGEIQAFGQLHPADHVALLYTSPRWPRRGLATSILAALERQAAGSGARDVRAEVSRVARALFEKAGYRVSGSEAVERAAVRIERFAMLKTL